ncbi:MAG: DUF11 domain-containing protein [Anaerolineae bacterium]|nr:DUF11 domain-containing protein [Anaerolineae bacterium]
MGGALRGWTLTLATPQGPKSYSSAQGMRVLDTLPPGFTLVSASPGHAGPNPVAWVDGIRAGETRSYTITARANHTGSEVVTNTATVSSPLPELNLSDNTSAAEVRINAATLVIVTPTVPITPTPPGGVLTITIPISNSGNITSTGGVITITLPNGEVIVFPIGEVPPGVSTTLEITITVPILSPGTTEIDIVIQVGEDIFVVSAPVDGLPRLALAKTSDPPNGESLRVGDHITYTLTVTNVGAVTATNVTLTDAVPLNTSYVAGSAQPAPASSNPFVWRVPSLAMRATFTARFSVQVVGVSTGTHPITNVAVLGGDFITPTQSNPVIHVYLPSAIRLLRFTAQHTVGGVRVVWVTGLEVNTFGFALLRSATGSRADATRVTDELISAKGASGASYDWLDETAQPDVAYAYWLQEIETSGRINEYGPAVTMTPDQPQGQVRVFLPLVVR